MPRRRLKAKPTKLKAAEDIMLPNVSDPSQRRSDVTGKVVRLLTKDGGSVKSGQPYVKCEAMKMIMQIKVSQDGKVSHKLIGDSILTTGDIIESGPSDQRPLHFLNLALKGFPNDAENQLRGALLDVSAEEASSPVPGAVTASSATYSLSTVKGASLTWALIRVRTCPGRISSTPTPYSRRASPSPR